MLTGRYEMHETKQPSVQPDSQRGRQTHILTVNTNEFFCTALEFWVRLSCASPCRICCQLLCIKRIIYYHDEDDDDETNDDDYNYYYYCISIVYVADSYWLFTTVEQHSYSQTYPVCVEFLYILCIVKQEELKKKKEQKTTTSGAIAE